MDVEIPCIACQAVLRVPSDAAGHRLRCPSCKAVFVMPSSQQMMEETVSGWIEYDVEEVFEDRQKHTDDRLRPRATPKWLSSSGSTADGSQGQRGDRNP